MSSSRRDSDFTKKDKNYKRGNESRNSFGFGEYNNIKILKIKEFDETQIVCDLIKNNNPIILVLEETDKILSQRVVDFVSGVVASLNGSLKKITTDIFLVTPSNISVTDGTKE